MSPLDFDGREDSLFHPYNEEKKLFMEYLEYHGYYADVPIDKMIAAYNNEYGEDYVNKWIGAFQESGGKSIRDFYSEEVMN